MLPAAPAFAGVDAAWLTLRHRGDNGAAYVSHHPVVVLPVCACCVLADGGLACQQCGLMHCCCSEEPKSTKTTSSRVQKGGESSSASDKQKARTYHIIRRAMCDALHLFESDVELEKRLLVRLNREPTLSSCYVTDTDEGQAMRPFGTLRDWRVLAKTLKLPSLVVFDTIKEGFAVVSARHRPHSVCTRSALYWIRNGAGPGFAVNHTGEDGGIFRIAAFQNESTKEEKQEREARDEKIVAGLLLGIINVFPKATFCKSTRRLDVD